MDCLNFSQFVNPKTTAIKKRRDGVYRKTKNQL